MDAVFAEWRAARAGAGVAYSDAVHGWDVLNDLRKVHLAPYSSRYMQLYDTLHYVQNVLMRNKVIHFN